MSRILIVEDESIIRAALQRLLAKHDYAVDTADSVDSARSLLSHHAYDLIISDLRLPGAPGTDLIAIAPNTPVLIMTSYASMRSAIDAMKLGAVDYIAKPFDHDEMLASVSKIIQQFRPSSERSSAAVADQDTDSCSLIAGSSPSVQELLRKIDKVSQTSATVLILGESGTGKELAARTIHQKSSRAQAPMISVNCAAIPDTLIESELFGHEKGAFTGADTQRSGLIEAADQGTLFLDEIGELPLEAQARLLRFLQEGEIRRVGAVHARKVDVRLIAATHRDLKTLAREGRFREDLYYRLYVMELRMPPLRERGEDIIELAQLFLRNHCARHQTQVAFSPSALERLRQHTWPGNVRELQNAIERAVILAEGHQITPDLFGLEHTELASTTAPTLSKTEEITPPSALDKQDLSLDDYFQRYVLDHQEQMNETELARTLGISRKCLWERRQKLGIPRRAKRATAG
ncbi:sigma-54-dependent transcriptional regulator [Nitrincola tapanii]|uniref:Sigma-54-dependent Fis family transcriptional regulator n=1 Tax=Nitrincola tapanii TaxID=1708751 RepID=A0A5A9VZ40_9GAMM|nr:sigma-54 dependent transcriptional regulator [Nitrincola tapanii]KAA0873663.1 sigma-54-dependent Fis family transcriptional regulator [Nitrincola tapanii]